MSSSSPIMVVPETYVASLRDLFDDLNLCFPEWKGMWQCHEQGLPENALLLFRHMVKTMPPMFFNIVYQNMETFGDQELVDQRCFLPGVDFGLFFMDKQCSATTKATLWKYLQMFLFMVVQQVDGPDAFGGDSKSLFEGIDAEELSNTLQKTMDEVRAHFDKLDDDEEEDDEEDDDDEKDKKDPSSSSSANMMDHLQKLFQGKIGTLAKELAEEITEDLKKEFGADCDDRGENGDEKQMFERLMKNPKRLMKMMQSVTSKLQEKMARGEISKSDLVKEASEMFSAMQKEGVGSSMKEGMQQMFKSMATSMGANSAAANASSSLFQQMMRKEEQKDRLRKKAAAAQPPSSSSSSSSSSANGTTSFSEKQLDDLMRELDIQEGDIATNRPPPPKRLNRKRAMHKGS